MALELHQIGFPLNGPYHSNGTHDEDSSEPSFIRLPRTPHGKAPDIQLQPILRGSKPGTHFIRRLRPRQQKLLKVSDDEFEATEAALQPETSIGRLWASTRARVIGHPLATSELPHQRLSKLKALAVYASDNLSSSAYATEETLIVLVAAGASALRYSLPITLALVALVVIVVTSYRQTIRAYPNGGGAYIVATDNLGFFAGLAGGSALLVDYVMTVAVSIAAGVAAITSAVPSLYSYRVELSLVCVALITTGNLRGIRESATIFALPTYFFVLSFAFMLAVGLIRLVLGAHLQATPPPDALVAGGAALTPFLLLRAFSSGAVALTGIEAVANGVPNFQPPEWRNAITVQAWMVTILASFFIGTTLLARHLGVVPSVTQTVDAQIARTVFGENLVFYAIQIGTMLILVLAANTAFADLPVLASVMAKDSVMPKQFAFRGERLAFSNGILLLGLSSSVVLILFHAETTRIIPLYAFGVFTAFTLSQFAMVVHWQRNREAGFRRSQIINGFGGSVTLVVAIIVGATKFTHGAWISMSIMLALGLVLWRVHLHYKNAAKQLGSSREGFAIPDSDRLALAGRSGAQTVLIPVDDINQAVLRSVAYAQSLSGQPIAVHVSLDHDWAEHLRRAWEESVPAVPFVVVDSPYRSLVEPMLAYVDALRATSAGELVTVVIPEFVTRWPWQRFLHNQLGLRLKRALASRPDIVIVEVPYHLPN